MSSSLAGRVIRFGVFELDSESGELRKSGSRIRMAQQPAQVLAVLVERPGEVVKREELRQKLWSPDTFVDFDHGLNKSVQKLRDALGDSAESPRFIETIPRVGYRFIAPVSEGVRQESKEQRSEAADAEVSKGGVAPPAETKAPTKPVWLLLAGSVALALAVAGGWVYRKHASEAEMVKRTPVREVSPAAHEAFLQGEHFVFSDGNADKARDYFQKTVELQPDYAAGWLGLAQYYGSGLVGGGVDPKESLAPMLAAAHKAVDLDGSLADARTALCGAILLAEHNGERADQECVRAIDLDPRGPLAYHMRARNFAAINRHTEGIAEEKIATELDPSGFQWGMARSYLWARQYDLGIADARMRLESSPRHPETLEILAALYRCKGMYKEAAQAWEAMYSARGDESSAAGVRRAFAVGRFPAVNRWHLAELKKLSLRHYVSQVFYALDYAELGQREETLRSLEEAYRVRDPLLLWVQNDPAYDFVHADPRYRTIIQGMGLPPTY